VISVPVGNDDPIQATEVYAQALHVRLETIRIIAGVKEDSLSPVLDQR
jgi:hypothetical protein